ncbi:hypothetical protein HF326_15555 [Bacillus altitudinis MN12]|jgi:hypothetical protein|uniref:Group-specific protein n=2 Tax=Bacillus TaxID=1386 RepID=A0A653MKR3_BACAB|nr:MULTISPECIES: hypothetical protein [Bacillus]EMI14767.1 group-specific protein [Bacillus stratosphericus LAMA 585]KML15441.1 hypothetical protein VL09_13890 [Bacillus stratosphericus]KQL43711.1 hypothetical protein AN962_05465 [Bacillus sp. FJAT-21955]MBW3702083.1 hypothetical protein [Bacillus aerophilus]MDH8712016.1 hypothetical protein [Micromonospora sp. 1209]CVN66230.1 Uncharacterised protein [Streptococcus pneumoniae]
MSDQQHNAAHEEEEEFNVYDMLPPAGTIIGEATEEEMEAAAALEVRHYAFMRLQDSYIQFDGSSYKELLKDFQELEFDSAKFWRAIARRLQVPYEWPIRIDHANGPIYIGETEDSRDVEESAE